MPDQDDSRPLVLLVEDEVLVRMTLTAMLEEGGFRVAPVAQADETLEVLAAVPDVRAVVTDVRLASDGMDGFELARRIHKQWGVGVVVVSGRAAPDQTELPTGVTFIAKPVHQATLMRLVRNAVESQDQPGQASDVADAPSGTQTAVAAAEADRPLTPRQQEVLALLVQGKSNREIAQALAMAENTVKVHLAAIFKVLDVSSRTGALLAGLKRLERE